MTELTTHTIETAPDGAKPLLQKVGQTMGFIPNLFAAMAESPATLEAYLTLAQLIDQTDFSAAERQLLLLSISRYRNCTYCLAAHGTLARMHNVPTESIAAIYFDQPLNDTKLEALRTFARATLEADGWVDKPTLNAFYHAGYRQQHVLEVILAISMKTLSNYVNHINDTPIDQQFLAGLPDNNSSH